jgi:DsbC/DsbD-like thiol-disulfide interchange protein
MTRSIAGLTSCSLLLIVSSACSTPPSNPISGSPNAPAASPTAQVITSESVVKVAAQPVEIPAGGSAEAIVRVTIQSGYHVNANPPTYSYLRATVLDISPADGVSAGAVAYPKALNKKLAFAEKPLDIYEGETVLKATLKADKATKTGERSLSAKLRIQACDDQVCYAPGSLEVAIPVNIK